MNKPERSEIFTRAEGWLKRASDAGTRAISFARSIAKTDFLTATSDADAAKQKRRVLLFGGAGAVIVVIALATLSRISGERAPTTQIDTRQAVTALTVSERAFEPRVAFSGEARPVRDIQVAAPAAGVRILELLVDEGDTVRQGQAMARLDSSLAGAQIRAAQASVAEAQSAAVRARGELDRAESIRDSGALSTEALEQRRAAAAATDARLAAARAQLQEVNARLGGGYVRAPASGLVIDRMAELGRNVDGQVLFRIAAGNDLEVAAEVAEADALALQKGQTAVFTLVDGSTVQAELRRPPASIDSRTRTGEALFALPRNTRVRAGMFLNGEAYLPARRGVSAPQSSILYEDGQAYVLVLDPQNRAHRTPVALGARDGDVVEITRGLTAGQRIIGAGAAFVQDGDSVRPIAPPAPHAATTGLRGRSG